MLLLPVEAMDSNQNSANESKNQPQVAQGTGNNNNTDTTGHANSIHEEMNDDMDGRENEPPNSNGENQGSSLIEPESFSNENGPSNANNANQGSSLIEPESFPNEIDPMDTSDQIDSRASAANNDHRVVNSVIVDFDQHNRMDLNDINAGGQIDAVFHRDSIVEYKPSRHISKCKLNSLCKNLFNISILYGKTLLISCIEMDFRDHVS